MKPLRRYVVLLALTAVAMAGPTAVSAHADGATDTAPTPVTETEDDTAWGTPPADDPEPADDGQDAATTRDTAWG